MQSRNHQNLDDQFRDELRDASFLPPVGVWERIEAQLPPGKPFYIRYRWQLTASVAALALLLTALWMKEVQNVSSSATTTETAFNSSVNRESASQSSPKRTSIQNADVIVHEMDIRSGRNERDVAETRSQVGTKPSGATNVSSIIASTSPYQAGFKTKSRPSFLPSAKEEPAVTDKVKEKGSLAPETLNAVQAGNFEKANLADALNPAATTVASINNELVFPQQYSPQSLPTQPFSYEVEQSNEDDVNQKVKSNKDVRQHMNVNQGFFMGPSFGYQLNRLSMQPFSPETDNSLMEYRSHGGVHYGITFGYDFPSRFGIMGEWVYSSSEGQRFVEDFGDFSVDKSIELDYMKLPVMVRYQMALQGKKMKRPLMLNMLGGVHYSMLRSKNTYINGELAYFDQKFNKHQWGLLAGAELDIYATKQLFFTIGARGGFAANAGGFPRMRGREGNDPLALNAGLYTRINFRFVQK